MNRKSLYNDVLLGIAVGDALGVPVEFRSRASLQTDPVRTMRGYGTHGVPPGTWSDDSSLSLCLAESLLEPFSLNTIAESFSNWLYQDHWTARGYVFDVGITTRNAISKIKSGVPFDKTGGMNENENGNGSLMRILPLLFYIKNMEREERFHYTKLVSSLTHAHPRSVLACFYYLEFARYLVLENDVFRAYEKTNEEMAGHFANHTYGSAEHISFDQLVKSNISQKREAEISSSGYVIHTLEASIWCLLTTNSFEDAVLKAVNLGDDTDTTGAVTGGLAGIIYGSSGIPSEWLSVLAKRAEIEDLAERLQERFR